MCQICVARLSCCHADGNLVLLQQFPCIIHPFVMQVLVYSRSGLAPEYPVKIVAVQMDMLGNFLPADIFGNMCINKLVG